MLASLEGGTAWPISSRSARAAAACRSSTWSAATGAITRVTLIEPDVYKPHNVERHLFPLSAVGQRKADLAEGWLKERRPDLEVRLLACDLMDRERQAEIDEAVGSADIGVCAADNEPAKFHWDALMRRHAKPWTLGEVLSGGIGGFVHWFAPGGPCYGCVASHLQRTVVVDKARRRTTPTLAAPCRKPPSPRAWRRSTPSPRSMRW